MIEVFKTNVNTEEDAKLLLDQIHLSYPSYKANFDLDDCDRIFRIEHKSAIEHYALVGLFGAMGFIAEVLPGDDSLFDEMITALQPQLISAVNS